MSEQRQFTTYKAELRILATLGLPAALLVASRTAQLLTDQAILGHLDAGDSATPLYLDASSQALLWMNLTFQAMQRGVCSAISVLTSQALGAGNKELVGAWLKTGCLFGLLGGICVMGLWLLTGQMLSVVSLPSNATASVGASAPSTDPVALAARYAAFSTGAILPSMFLEALNAWLIAQRVVKLQLAVYATFFGVNFGLNMLLVHGAFGWTGLGFDGSPLATTCSRVGQFLSLLLLAKLWGPPLPRSGWYEATRPSRLRTFAKQALPGVLGSGLEELALQSVGLLAARLGEVQMATHASMLMCFFWLTSPTYGMMTATSQRVGFYLGAGSAKAARKTAKLCLGVLICFCSAVAATLMLARFELGHVFSSDQAVISLIAQVVPLVCAAYTLMAAFYAAMATLNGQGRPLQTALAFFLGAFCVSPTLGYALAYPLHCCFGVALDGLWLGLIAGYTVTTLVACTAVWRSDWQDLALRAQARSELLAADGCDGPADVAAILPPNPPDGGSGSDAHGGADDPHPATGIPRSRSTGKRGSVLSEALLPPGPQEAPDALTARLDAIDAESHGSGGGREEIGGTDGPHPASRLPRTRSTGKRGSVLSEAGSPRNSARNSALSEALLPPGQQETPDAAAPGVDALTARLDAIDAESRRSGGGGGGGSVAPGVTLPRTRSTGKRGSILADAGRTQ